MKFNYPEIETVTHLNKRWYDTSAGAYPSITSVLGTTAPEEAKQALANWQNSLGAVKAAQVSKAATDRGTNVHLLCERYLKGEDVSAPINGARVPDADMQSFNALKLKLKNIDEVWGQEVALFSTWLEVAGRCDLIGVYKGEPVIVDFKTSGRIKSKNDIGDYALQLAFYAAAHNEMFGTNIKKGVILMVAETGFPMEFSFDLEEQMPALIERVQAFWDGVINSKV